MIESQKNSKLTYNKGYIHKNTIIKNKNMINLMAEGDNNPIWFAINTNCKNCNKFGIKRMKIHKTFVCKCYKEKRVRIINSLITEINDYYTRKENKEETIQEIDKINSNDINLITKCANKKIKEREALNHNRRFYK